MATPPVRAINLGLQLAAIRHTFPAAKGHVRRGELVCTVPLEPTAASRTYTIRLTHRHGAHPQVDVIEPKLELHPDADALPHVYRGDHLCLYYHGEWDDNRLLADTVLPWAAEWLLHYELWLATATWHGGGTTHMDPHDLQAAHTGARNPLYRDGVSSNDDPARGDVDDGQPLVVAPRLEHLPLNELPWERYELLLRRIAQDERGLRQVRLYGSRGQSQYGIDLAGQAPDGTGEAIQSKRYTTFTAADLTAAVAKFVDNRSMIPFPVDRLCIAAACDSDRRQVTDELYRIAATHPDLEIDFWDRRTQCDMLRRRRDIVAEFFGAEAVDAFCYPAPLDVVPVAPPERVELADALLRGPAEITGARTRLALADRLQIDEPERAADAVQDAIELLRGGGFAAHAAVLVPRRAELLGRAGRRDDGVRLLSGEFWRAVDVHDNDEADALLRAMTAHDLSTTSEKLVSIADHALTVLRDPLGLPTVALDDLAEDSVTVELARLALLMTQTSAIDPGCTWTTGHAARLTALAVQVEGTDDDTDVDPGALANWIRIEVADATGEWANLVTAARRHRLPRIVAARILARYAMYVAERGGHDEPTRHGRTPRSKVVSPVTMPTPPSGSTRVAF